ncbi:MAG TPA: sigma 54-interacting transcriptional regulator [Vicinamibacterales bacterium]|nr:sigma 54-interacting transcriptional regulator [Vicinamibacterales bacterium]
MTPVSSPAAELASTALLFASLAEEPELGALVRGLGFQPLRVDSADILAGFTDPIGLCLVDLRQNGEAIRIARTIRSQQPGAVVIGIADPERPTAAADAIRAGVFDVLPRPPMPRDLEALLSNAREQATLAALPQASRPAEAPGVGVVGTSPAMRVVMDLVQRAASARCGMLLCGERGTGREMIARAIHAHNPNHYAPFVKVDCAGPPEDLELQLFGLINRRSGLGSPERRSLERIGRHSRLIDAVGGILFLENVVELPARIQARLVRVLRDREVFLEDGREPILLDVRPIASVDSSVDAAVEEGRLREDLHERLSLIRIDVPALRQRREDIPVLATHFLKELCRDNGKPMKTFTRPALTLLSALPWRGNAPELRGLLERLILLVPGGLIRLEDVLAHTQFEGTLSPTGLDATLRQARAKFERDYIAAVLQHQHGRIADAAKVLGIQRTNLYRKMRRLNLIRPKASSREQ